MKLAQKLAYKAIEMILEQIESGKDIDGKSFTYSENPFYMPYKKKVVDKFGKNNKDKLYKIVKRKNKGKMGLIILKGYKSYREAFGRDSEGDFLQFTGAMINSIDVIKSTDNEAEIGFTDTKAAQIAYWLNVAGAGKSRKLWKFFGLTKENKLKLAEIIKVSGQEDIDSLLKNIIFPK